MPTKRTRLVTAHEILTEIHKATTIEMLAEAEAVLSEAKVAGVVEISLRRVFNTQLDRIIEGFP
jgi:hypothetical protein